MKTVKSEIYTDVEPNCDELCLCGSGLLFNKCCADEYWEYGLTKESFKCYNARDYKKALKYFRYDISKYLVYHRAHTLPLTKFTESKYVYIYNVDIDAMSEFINHMMYCYNKNGIRNKYYSFLQQMSDKFSDIKWKNQLIYQEACWILHPDWNSENEIKAKDIMLRLGDIKYVDDVKHLQLYLHLIRDELSFSERIHVIDKIINTSKDPDDLLLYKCQKGTEYFLIMDEVKAEQEIKSALEPYIESNKVLNVFQNDKIGHALLLLGIIENNPKRFEDSRRYLFSALESNMLSSNGKANIYFEIGNTFRIQSNHEEAIKYYLLSYDQNKDATSIVLCCRSLIATSEIDKVRSYISNINIAQLTPNGKFDMAIMLSELAVKTRNIKDILFAIANIKTIETIYPYFDNDKKDMTIGLLEMLSNDRSDTPEAKNSTLHKILLFVNRYGEIKPNIFGIGINVNEIISSHAKRKPN